MVAARNSETRENEAFAPGRNDVRREDCRQADVSRHVQVFDRCISTVSYPGIHDPTAIIAVIILGEVPPHGGPVARREVRQEAFLHWMFQPQRLRL